MPGAWGNSWVPVGGNKVHADGWIGGEAREGYTKDVTSEDPAGFTPAMPYTVKDGRDKGLCSTCRVQGGKGRAKKDDPMHRCTNHIRQDRIREEKLAAMVVADEDE